MQFEHEVKEKIEYIEMQIVKYLGGGYPEVIYNAMKYGALSGGKRMRGILCLAFCEAFGGDAECAGPFAAAIEMIHAYSLIHDDLPALDNDDFRRGKPSCHKKYGEAIAILAGDALLNKAFETMSWRCLYSRGKEPTAMHIIANAAGTCGMIGGQTADILYADKNIDRETLLYIHNNKTAALIRASIVSGALLAGVDASVLDTLEKIGGNLGLAFQIKDDILDVTGDAELLGKSTGRDKKNNKSTYVTINGLEKANTDFQKISGYAFRDFKKLDISSHFLEKYLEFLVDREY